MSELFLEIVNRSLSAGWLILAVLILRLLLKSGPRWVHVALWGMVGIRLVCPFSIESVLSLIPSAQTISPAIMMDATPSVSTGIPALNAAVNPIITESFAPTLGASANPLQIWIPVASVGWLLGMGCLVIYAVVSYWRLRRRIATAVLIRDNIYESELVDSPFVLGLFRPKVYIPIRRETAQGSHIIAHEQAHIARRDHWWKPLGFLLLIVYWFHPLMWVAYVLLCRDMEMACDERVIRDLSEEARADYSQALLNASIRRRKITACPLAFGEVGVRARVMSVLHYKKPPFWVVAVCVVLCLVVAVCFLTDPVRPSLQVLPQVHSHTYGVVELVYEPLNISMTLTPQVNTPSYAVTESMELIQQWVLTDSWGSVGTLTEFTLTRENFDEQFYFDEGWNGETADSIRKNTESAWMTIHNQDELYYLLQMKNGEIFMAYGYYDYAEKDDPGSDDTAILWLFRLAIDVNGDYGVVARSGENVVPMTVFPEGTAIGNYANAVHWLTVEPGEEFVPFRTYRDGEEFRGHYLAFDAETYQELSYNIPSGLDPQTYLFQNADPNREYIVLMLSGQEGADQYCFGVRFSDVADGQESIPYVEPMINIGGFVYVSTGEGIPMEVEPSGLRKKISYQVPASEEPTQDGQANFDCVGAEVVWVEGDYAVLLNGEWIRFTERDYPRYYLTIGREGVASLYITAGGRSLLACPEDFGLYEMGEQIWLEGLDGLRTLRGVTITARDEENMDLFSVRIADSHYQTEDTVVCDDWIITREME